MKRIFALGMTMMFTGAVFAQNDRSELPQQSSDFIDEHFSSERIAEVDVDDSWYNVSDSETYEVKFENGVELDFNKKGEITEIESDNGESIPESILPASVRNHVQQNYSDARIVNYEKDKKGHEVELEDGRELEFDENGEFKKEDS